MIIKEMTLTLCAGMEQEFWKAQEVWNRESSACHGYIEAEWIGRGAQDPA